MDLVALSTILKHLSISIAIFPLTVGLFFYKKASKPIQWLIYYLISVIMTEIIAKAFEIAFGNNNPVYHIFTVIQFAAFFLIYQIALKGKMSKQLTWTCIATFTVLAILSAIFLQGLWEFNSYISALECLFVVLLPLYYFYSIIQELKIKHLSKTPMFWISVATLVYFSTGFFIFLTHNYFVEIGADTTNIWTLHSIFIIITNILLAIGIWNTRWQNN